MSMQSAVAAAIDRLVQAINAVDAKAGGGGADPWTYVKLGANAINATTANVDTALAFTPDPDSQYIVEGMLFLQSAATTTGVRPGIKWPTAGVTQNIAWMASGSSATAFTSRLWGNLATANAASTGVPVANEGIFGKIEASFVTGGAPAGNFIITLASEIAASEARIMANSWIRYRKI